MSGSGDWQIKIAVVEAQQRAVAGYAWHSVASEHLCRMSGTQEALPFLGAAATASGVISSRLWRAANEHGSCVEPEHDSCTAMHLIYAYNNARESI